MRTFLPILLLLSVVAVPSAAAARADVPCLSVDAGAIQVDGLLDDWRQIQSVTQAAADPKDAAIAVRCAYDPSMLYVSVDVTDDRLIRTPKHAATEDHLVLSFAGHPIQIFPASAEYKAPLFISAKGPKIVDSLQKQGWSVELGWPLAKVPGYTKNGAGIPFSVAFHDADLLATGKIEDVVSIADSMLSFSDADALLAGFLKDLHMKKSDITLEVMANMDGSPGTERVLVVGRVLAVLSDQYQFIELPVASPKDILEVKIVDLSGEGKSSAVIRYQEHGNGGSREVISVWNTAGSGWVRTFAHEIGKSFGGAKITNTWALAKPKKKRGMDLVIKPGAAQGVSETSWNEAPASDMVPILLPWDKSKKQEVWTFKGDEVSGG